MDRLVTKKGNRRPDFLLCSGASIEGNPYMSCYYSAAFAIGATETKVRLLRLVVKATRPSVSANSV